MRCPASAAAHPCGPGCCASSPTRPATGVAAEGRRTALALRAAAEAPPGDAAPSPEGSALSHDERARLLASVEALPDEQRLAIACRYFLDLSEEETAAALGVRRGTVKSRLSRALERLREADAGA